MKTKTTCTRCGYRRPAWRPSGLPSGWANTVATNALLAWRPQLADCSWLGVRIISGIRENA